MPHLGEVHRLRLETTREFATHTVDRIKCDVDRLENPLLIKLRFTLDLDKLRSLLGISIENNLAELLGNALLVR